jgi:hypothetical protein
MYTREIGANRTGGFQMNMIQAVVVNGKIEIKAPAEIRDGETVSVLVVGHAVAEEEMSADEIAITLKAMDEFNAAFPEHESGEDLSKLARVAGEAEKAAFAEKADRLKRLFD